MAVKVVLDLRQMVMPSYMLLSLTMDEVHNIVVFPISSAVENRGHPVMLMRPQSGGRKLETYYGFPFHKPKREDPFLHRLSFLHPLCIIMPWQTMLQEDEPLFIRVRWQEHEQKIEESSQHGCLIAISNQDQRRGVVLKSFEPLHNNITRWIILTHHR